MNKKQGIMDKLIVFLEKYLEPVAAKIENQRHISTIKNGMIALMAVLMVGSFFTDYNGYRRNVSRRLCRKNVF